jgi:cell division protein FtsZ
MQNALKGLRELEQFVDTLIVVPNDRVATLCQHKFTLIEAFHMADEVLDNGVRAITELITVTGLINLDFADLRTIMKSKGRALMGIGIAEGDNRAVHAAQEAIVCPLLEQSNINGATGVIVNIKGGRDVTMSEVEEAVNTVKKSGAPDANIIFGVVVDREKEHSEITVTVIAAGFQKGVSEDFLSTDGKDTFENALANAFDFPDPETPDAADAEAAFAALEDSALAPPPDDPDPIPGQAELFPDKNEEIDGESAVDVEDLGIPAFIRRRMKKRH